MENLFETFGKLMIYVCYYDAAVKVLYNKDGSLHRVYKKNLEICTFALKVDEVPNELDYKEMSFSEFFRLVLQNNFAYLGYFYDVEREWVWHKDAYKAYTKEAIDEFLKEAPDKYKLSYEFLKKNVPIQ